MFNVLIIALYLGLILTIGVYFRKDNHTTSDYFRARGSLPWFWVGASAYVSQFSAWTFTSGAAEAYSNGYNILITFWSNAIAFIIAGLYFSKKFRQLRVNNATEAIALRFGKTNSIVFSAVNIPNFLIYPALWLSGLAVFIAASFDMDVKTTIILVGGLTIFMSVIGGTWAIVSSDFLQMIIITIISITCAIVAYIKFQDIGGLMRAIPLSQHFEPKSSNSILLYGMWAIYMCMQKIISTNNFNNVNRFNSVDSSKSATKAAFFAAGIYIIGTFIWFVPPWFISTQFTDLSSIFPALRRPNQAAYLLFVQEYMPIGILGVVVVALFAATMSSLDSSLNWCSGYVLTLFNEKNKHNVFYARALSTIFGIIVIATALYLDRLWTLSFFDITYTLLGYLYLPLIIPVFLSIWIRKTPDWGFLASILIGLSISATLGLFASNKGLWEVMARNLFGILDPSRKDITHISLFTNLMAQLLITGGSFVLSSIAYNKNSMSEHRLSHIQEFYSRLSNPVKLDITQHRVLKKKFNGINTIAIGVGIILLEIILLSNTPILLLILGLLSTVGIFLLHKKSFA